MPPPPHPPLRAPPPPTALQLDLTASTGGVGFPSPLLIADPAVLASMADTLPNLLTDAPLNPHLTATTAYLRGDMVQ
eukprot:248420-Prymnesium_polylepis.1